MIFIGCVLQDVEAAMVTLLEGSLWEEAIRVVSCLVRGSHSTLLVVYIMSPGLPPWPTRPARDTLEATDIGE